MLGERNTLQVALPTTSTASGGRYLIASLVHQMETDVCTVAEAKQEQVPPLGHGRRCFDVFVPYIEHVLLRGTGPSDPHLLALQWHLIYDYFSVVLVWIGDEHTKAVLLGRLQKGEH
jgi:hypothetical protein